MNSDLSAQQRQALSEKLAESLSGPLPDLTPRRVFGQIEMPGKATAVVGMRRSGKTFFLHQLRRERLERGVARGALPYINFEDERLAGLKGSQLGFLIDEYHRHMPDEAQGSAVTWCFDEIQVVPEWERFVRRLLDSGGTAHDPEVVVTGSSAAMLSREVATSLRGRAWEVPIYPFSFLESLIHKGPGAPKDPGFLVPEERTLIERAFMEWLVVGGFPEAQGLGVASRHQLLLDYVDVAMLRDVMERHSVGNVTGLRWLVRHLLGNAAGSFSVEKFFAGLKSQGIAIAKDTVHQLLAHIDDCFLVRTVWMESTSERQRMVNPRKSYPVDQGLIPIFDRSGRRNTGRALETAVLIELMRRRCEVTYVRTKAGHEVDFLARSPAGQEELIQVCADASDPSTATRELRALQEANVNHPQARQRLLTLTRDGIPNDLPTDISAVPAYEWLLRDPS